MEHPSPIPPPQSGGQLRGGAQEGELFELLSDLRGHLEWLRESGVRELPAPPKVEPARPVAQSLPLARSPQKVDRPVNVLRPAAPPPATPSPSAPAPAPRNVAVAPPAPQANGAAPRTLEQIRAELGDCQRCKLGKGRKNLVYGVGNPKAELVFVGEGPGADEDAQGIPFVGKAGQLLTKMIEAMGFRREDTYICNVVKCRPPGNRNPEPDEIEACEPFLKAQLASLKPKVIVTLGKFAAQTLLRDSTAISRLRGNWREYCGIKLMPTFHPAYLLRSPEEKKKAWADLQLVMREFGMSRSRQRTGGDESGSEPASN